MILKDDSCTFQSEDSSSPSPQSRCTAQSCLFFLVASLLANFDWHWQWNRNKTWKRMRVAKHLPISWNLQRGKNIQALLTHSEAPNSALAQGVGADALWLQGLKFTPCHTSRWHIKTRRVCTSAGLHCFGFLWAPWEQALIHIGQHCTQKPQTCWLPSTRKALWAFAIWSDYSDFHSLVYTSG